MDALPPRFLPFRPIDIGAEARRLRLVQRGKDDGARNHPPSDALAPALAEEEVLGAITTERARCLNDLAAQLRAARDALAQLETAMDVAQLRNDTAMAQAQFHEVVAAWGGRIGVLGRATNDAVQEFEDFRTRHHVRRAPRQPANRGMTVALLALCLVVESALNGVFFAQGSDFGLLGGIALALGLSAVNVIAGFVNGWAFLRAAQHRGWVVKAFGMLCFLALAAAIVAFNGYVAHFRDAYARLGEATNPTTIAHDLLTAPFVLASIQSWLLFAIGVLFSGFATYKGFGFDDPYPGLGAAGRRLDRARDEYAAERANLLDRAAEIRDEIIGKLTTGAEALRGASTQREQVLGTRQRMRAEYEAHEAHLSEACQNLLTIYRDANTAVRTTPGPAHFQRRFAFPDKGTDSGSIQALMVDPGPQHDATALLAELDTLRDAAVAAYEHVLAHAPPES
ncbi:MAG TPA: hypothetical protein VGG99_13180 [Acetobacteraceae bacterium]|jgi:zinc transporter ZupT